MSFITQGKTSWKLIIIIVVIILAILIGAGVLDRNKGEFTLRANEKAEIIYSEDEEPYEIILNSIDTQSGKVNIFSSFSGEMLCLAQPTTRDIKVGEQINCFSTEECATYFKLIKLESEGATFETWYTCAPPGPEEIILPKEIIITEEDETADWQTYRNKEHGFEIKYPPNYETSTEVATDIGPAIVSSLPPAKITFLVYDNPDKMLLSEWVKSDLVIHDLSIKWREVVVDEKESLSSPFLGNMDGGIEYEVLIPQDDKIYRILFSTKSQGTENEVDIFDQMLSTFKFIEEESEFIKVLSPNGGEEWVIDKTHKVVWNCPDDADMGKIDIFIKDRRKPLGEDFWPIGGFIECSAEEYSWEIGNDIAPGENSFKIQLRYIAGGQDIIDESDNYFSIKEDESTKEQACIDSGGTVQERMCCLTASDFPNLCLIGACACSPEKSHEIKICDCGGNRCFDGETCLPEVTHGTMGDS